MPHTRRKQEKRVRCEVALQARFHAKKPVGQKLHGVGRKRVNSRGDAVCDPQRVGVCERADRGLVDQQVRLIGIPAASDGGWGGGRVEWSGVAVCLGSNSAQLHLQQNNTTQHDTVTRQHNTTQPQHSHDTYRKRAMVAAPMSTICCTASCAAVALAGAFCPRFEVVSTRCPRASHRLSNSSAWLLQTPRNQRTQAQTQV